MNQTKRRPHAPSPARAALRRTTARTKQIERLIDEARRALPRNRARAERLVANIVRWLPERARRFPEIGEALAALKSPALYGALGHKSFVALLRTRHLASPATAAKLIRIAQELPAARARTMGLQAAFETAKTRHARRAPPKPGPTPRSTSGAMSPTGKLGSSTERAALARLERRVHDRLRDGERSSWDVGMLFDKIARASHHKAAGYETLERYADARFPEHGYRTLSRYRRVALAFTRQTTIRHGTQKLDLALRYIDATPAHERPAEIPRLKIAVTNVGPIPFARVTTKQLESAIASMTTPPVTTPALPRGAAPIVHTLEKALSHGLPWPNGAPHLTTRVAKSPTGHIQALVTIHDIPIDSIDRLAKTLSRSRSPSS